MFTNLKICTSIRVYYMNIVKRSLSTHTGSCIQILVITKCYISDEGNKKLLREFFKRQLKICLTISGYWDGIHFLGAISGGVICHWKYDGKRL